MTEEEIKNARANYNRIITDRGLLGNFNRSAIEELKDLEKDPKVKRYIYLKDIIEHQGNIEYNDTYSNDSIVNIAFDNIASNTIDSKKIYVFMGFADKNEDRTVEKEKIDYAIFTDLETLDIVNISYSDYEIFVKNNKVIIDNNPYINHSVMYYENRLFEIRKELFNYLINNDQEVAIQKTLNRKHN